MANVALPESVSKPVEDVKLPVMPFCVVNASTSSLLSRLPVIWTVALSMFVSSTSETIRADVIAVALTPSVNESALVSAPANIGASFAGLTEIDTVAGAEVMVSSDTVNVKLSEPL